MSGFSPAQPSSLLNPWWSFSLLLTGDRWGGHRTIPRGSWVQSKTPSPELRGLCVAALCPSALLTLLLAILAQCHSRDSPTHARPFQADYVCGLAPGGGNCRPFCSTGGRASSQTNRDPLSEQCWGLMAPHCPIDPNLPPQPAVSLTQLLIPQP